MNSRRKAQAKRLLALGEEDTNGRMLRAVMLQELIRLVPAAKQILPDCMVLNPFHVLPGQESEKMGKARVDDLRLHRFATSFFHEPGPPPRRSGKGKDSHEIAVP